jgi:photosystem II stability/assembly factor-like uncharacterized protein
MGEWRVKHWLVLLVVIGLAGIVIWFGVRAIATPSPPSAVNLWAVSASDATHIAAVGGTDDSRGDLVVATSSDGGTTWAVSKPSAPALTTLATAGARLIGGTECFDYGDAPPPTSCLFGSDDGGQSWHDLGAGLLVDPTFIDSQTGWAHTPPVRGMPSPATLFATTDGGQTWQAAGQPCTDTTPSIYRAVPVAPGHGYVLCRGSTGNGSSYPWQLLELTTDGNTTVLQQGDTYAPGAAFDGDDVRGLAMLPDGHGYLLTQKIWRTTDGGRTWTSLATGETIGGFESIVMLDDSTAFASLRAVGNYTRIYGTSNGGESWSMLGSWSFY